MPNDDSITIQQLHDNVVSQASLGGAVVLSSFNMPSEALWTKVAIALAVNEIDISPPSPDDVLVGPISGNSFTITGNLSLLGFAPQLRTVTVRVDVGVPNFSFVIGPRNDPSWTFGDWHFPFETMSFGRLTQTNVLFTWDSRINLSLTTSPLSYSATLQLVGPFAFLVAFAGTSSVPWNGPILYDVLWKNQPAFDLRAPLTAVPSFTIAGFMDVGAPFVQAKASYTPNPDDETQLVTNTDTNFGMVLQESGTTLAPFTFLVPIAADNSLLSLHGKYGAEGQVLSLGDVCRWLLDLNAPPSLPAPLDGFFNNVGLESFGAAFASDFTSGNFGQVISLQVNIDSKSSSQGGSPIWNIYNNQITVERIYMNASVIYPTDAALISQAYLFGAELKIFELIFTLEMGYRAKVISLHGDLSTPDGLPMRFNDLLRKLNSNLNGVNLEDFFELTFSEIGADFEYNSNTSAYAMSVYTMADLSLRLFGKELLALHDLYVEFAASGNMNAGTFQYDVVHASGKIAILGFTFPASLTLSSAVKKFEVGPFSFTLGDIVKFLVQLVHPSWDFELPAPWNILDSIGFENLMLTFDLNEDSISLSTGVLADFGFISVTHLSLTYYQKTPKAKKEGVVLSLQGTFLGLPITTDEEDDEGLSWDVINDKPPEVPGGGEQIFKLDYLGLGQHVSFRDPGPLETIGQVMTALETNLRPTTDDANPLSGAGGLVFNQNSGWLIGAKFTVLETVTISAIFNDPQLYGIRIAVDGPRAGSFQGLEFEILYRKITDTIGLYHIELKLPDVMRHLEFGEVSVTLPIVVIDIYTNGNFRLDFGFPSNASFERSFAIQVFPFVGFGGFYIALLDGATSKTVPQITNGEFSPVVEFGFGLSVGVGKTIHEGILSGGLTLTVEGILEGTLAWFNPTDVEREKATYWSILGTVAIVGELFGEIDFAVIKASVEVKAYARATLLIESYQPIFIALDVGVEAHVKVKIFFFTIHLSFEFTLHEEFTIGSAQPTPWVLADPQSSSNDAKRGKRLLRQRPRRNLRPRTRRPSIARMLREPRLDFATADTCRVAMVDANDPVLLTFFPSFTQSNSKSIVGDDGQSAPYKVQSVPMFVLNNTIPQDTRSHRDVVAAAMNNPVTPFNRVVASMLTRVIDARVAARGGDQTHVTSYDLAVIYTQLLAGLADPAFSYDSLSTYFASNLPFQIAMGSASGLNGSATIFPMPPAIAMTSSDGVVNVNYATDSRLMVDASFLAAIDAYFRSLNPKHQTGVAELTDESNLPARLRRERLAEDGTETMTAFVFRDYFLLMTRGAVQASINYLRNYLYLTANDLSLDQIAASLAASIPQPELTNPSAFSIALANQKEASILNTAAKPSLSGVLYQTRTTDTVQSIATAFGVTALQLLSAAENANAKILVINSSVAIGNLLYVVADARETVQSVAMRFGILIQALIDANPGIGAAPLTVGQHVNIPSGNAVVELNDTFARILERNAPWGLTLAQLATACAPQTGILQPLSVWSIPTFSVAIREGDTLQLIAARYNLELADLIHDGLGAATGLLLNGKSLLVPNRPEILIADLVSAIVGGPAVNDLAGTVSRFLMQGLRIPSGSTAPPDFLNMQPLYNRTGQQFDAPASGVTSYSLSMTSAASWLTFVASSAYEYSASDFETIAAFKTSFAPIFQPPTPVPLMAYAPNRYSLGAMMHWQTPEGTTVVTPSAEVNAAGEPLLWPFPDTLLQRLASGPAAASGISHLKFALTIGVQSDPNAPIETTPVELFAWATTVDLKVQLVNQPENTIVNVDNDYQMLGADEDGRKTLQALWAYMNAVSDPATIYLLFAADPANPNGNGLVSATVDSSATLVLKTNLSTYSTQGVQLARDVSTVYSASVADAKHFVLLLWECSTVHTGGYYLNYTQAQEALGLPSNIFDESGFATLKMLVVFDSQKHTAGGAPPEILTFNNTALLAQNLDTSVSNLFVEASSFRVPPSSTLASVATAMGFASALDFATNNQDIKLLLLTGAVIRAGGNTHTIAVGDTLRSVADLIAGGSLSTLVNDILATPGLLAPDALVQYAPEQLRLQSTAPVGGVGFLLVRTNPDPNDLPISELTPQQQLSGLFNLLGYDIQTDPWFAPPENSSGEGLPSGPTQSTQATVDPLQWIYRNTFQASRLALPAYNYAPALEGLPSPSHNPYAGLARGSNVAVQLQFQDIYGNRTALASSSAPVVHLPFGYTDGVFAATAWPAVAFSYEVLARNATQFSLVIDHAFDLSNYVSGQGRSLAQSSSSIATDTEKIRQIYYQFVQPDVQLRLATTLSVTAKAPAPIGYFPWRASLFDPLDSIQIFLAGIASMKDVVLQPAGGDTLAALAAPYLVDAGAMLENNSALAATTLFDFSTTTSLTYPIYSVTRAGDSLEVLATRESTTVTLIAGNNAPQPLPPGRIISAPRRTIPTAPDTIGNRSLQQLGDAYAASPLGIAGANAASPGILRAGTRLSLRGRTISIAGTDTFDSLVTRFMQYTVATPGSLLSIAESYGMTAVELALANETVTGIWAGTFVYMGHSEQAAAADNLYAIATRFNDAGYPITVATLAEANMASPNLFANDAVLTTGLYDVTISEIVWANVNVTSIFNATAQVVTNDLVFRAGDTLNSISAKYGFSIDDLAARNAVLPDFFISGTPLFIRTETYVPASGMSIAEVVSTLRTTYAALGSYNATHPLRAQLKPNLQVPTRLVVPSPPPLLPYTVVASDTLSAIATKLAGSATSLSVANQNWTLPYALTPGVNVTFGSNTLTILETDTFATLQSRFASVGPEPTRQQLVDVLDVLGALRLGGTLVVAAPTVGSTITPSQLATRFGVDALQFLRTNKSTAALLASGVSLSIRTITLSTRTNEIINTLLRYFQQSDATITLDELLATLASSACLSSTAYFLLPPPGGSFAQGVTTGFPDLIFPIDVTLSIERLNFEITQDVLSALAAAGVPESSIIALQPMAGALYTNGDAFRATLRTNLAGAFATFPLDLALQLSALPSAFVDPTMNAVASVLRASSLLPPRLIDDKDGVTTFATAFEAAFGGTLKLGVGARSKKETDSPRKMWGAQFGPNGYSYSLTPAPSYFALQPLSNSLISKTGVRMQRYVPGVGLEPADPVDLDAIELDTWAQQFAAAVDLFLSAPYAIPANQRKPDKVAVAIACKARLAGIIAGGVANLLESPLAAGDLAAAREAFEDRLKIRLSNAYGSETILQYPVAVTSSNSSDPKTAPRLAGKPSSISFTTGEVETIGSIALAFHVSQEFLLDAIGAMTGILNDGVNGAPPAHVKYDPTGQVATLAQGETLDQLAAAFKVPLYGLIDTLTVVSGDTLFAPRTSVNITSVSAVIGNTGHPGVTVPPNSFDDLAYYFDLPVSFTARAVQDIPAIFASTVTSLSYNGRTVPVSAADTLRNVAQRLDTTASLLAEFYRGTPRLLRSGTVAYSLSVLPQYGLTTSKIPLSKPSSQLTFFVDVESPSRARKLFMNLNYAVNELEFDIASVTGIDDYQASSWLTLVLPLTSSQPNIGAVEVPILLRGYPTSPILQSQEGTAAPVPPGTNPPLTTLKSWEYEYTFEYLVAAQDEIYTTVTLTDVSDVSPPPAQADPPPLTLFEALAQFVLNWNQIQDDLDLLPSMKPDSEAGTVESAINAFATLTQQITDAWASDPLPRASIEAASEVHEYLVTFRTRPETARDLATMIFLGLTPGETFWPDAVWIFHDEKWVALTREAIQPGSNEVVFDFPPAIPITASTRYRVACTALDVIRFQSARSSVRIERNRHLISQSPTARTFAYETPDVSFANPFTPLLERDEPYTITGVTLADALSTFFQDLFNPSSPAWTSLSTRDITITCGYRFALTAPLTATTPVVHHTRYAFAIKSDYQTTPGTFVYELASAVTTWQSANLPPGTHGAFVFDVVVYETKTTSNTRPVLELRNVEFLVS
jgi:LysM repeat protein